MICFLLSFVFYLQRRRRLYKHYLVCHFVFPKAICILKSSFSMTSQKASLLLQSTPPFSSNSFRRYLQPLCLFEAKSWKIITKPLTCSADTKPKGFRICLNCNTSCRTSKLSSSTACYDFYISNDLHIPMICFLYLLSFIFKGGAVYTSTTLYVISFFRKLFVCRKGPSQ